MTIGTTRRAVIGSAAAMTLAASTATYAQPRRRPHIVFILADDIGHSDLGCYGKQGPDTPAIDSLAANGLLFTQAYSNSCVCSATRLGLITGRYQYRLPAGLEEPIAGYKPTVGLPPEHPTIPSLLRRAGYTTALVGKWHMGVPPAHGPLRSGYERFFGFYHGATDYFQHHAPNEGDNPEAGLIDGDTPVKHDGYLTDLFGDRAVAEIERAAKGDKPLFLSLHFTAPHWPWEGREDAAVSRTITNLRDPDRGNLAKYHELIRAMDENVAKVLAALVANGMAEDTIVIFSSDNGGERFSDTWPFVGMKGELLEGGIRVPLLVRWPRVIAAGGRSDQVTISMDWLPTLLAAAGGAADPAHPSDGMSLLPVLEGGSTLVSRTLFWRHRANDQAAVRDGQWKYLKLGDKEALFDLSQDERERANLKEREPERFAALKARFAAWNATMLPYPPKSYSEDVRLHYIDRY